MDVGGANDFEMSEQNKRIRPFLAENCMKRRHNNVFEWGDLVIQIDCDSYIKSVDFQKRMYVSIYDKITDTIMPFFRTC